jgi:hypothetical protein
VGQNNDSGFNFDIPFYSFYTNLVLFNPFYIISHVCIKK